MQKRRTRFLLILVILMAFLNVNFFASPVFSKDDEEDIRNDIDKVQDKLDQEQANLEQSNANLQTTQRVILSTSEKIERQENEIEALENRIKLNQSLLKDYLQELFWNHETDELVEMALFKESWQKIVLQDDNLLSTKEKLLTLLDTINDNKEELSEKKAEHEDLLAQKEAEEDDLVEEISTTKASIAELQSKLSELKSDLSRILGKSYDAGEIKDAIKFAAKVTGVRKGFIFGMLSMESGGNPNAGKCTYKNSGMSSARKEYFKDICDELDYNYKKQPVSCSPAGYSGSGGAMGAAQFMPDTWWGYKSRIAKATGHNPPDPWSLVDGVMAMALKLENDGATGDKVRIKVPRAANAEQFKKYPQCSSYKSSVAQKKVRVKGEIYASMLYLGWNCYGYANYAPGVQNLADGYDDL